MLIDGAADSSDILFPSSPTCRLPLTPTHHLQSVPSSPSLTHNISQPPSPAANTAATSWQIIPDDASSASSQSSSEMDGFSRPRGRSDRAMGQSLLRP
jgi:hypothetical protein